MSQREFDDGKFVEAERGPFGVVYEYIRRKWNAVIDELRNN
jgi:hypothetical protein